MFENVQIYFYFTFVRFTSAKMPYNRYIQISEERYNTLINRYKKFIENIDKVDQEPINIFDPLPKQFLDELQVIRDVSKELAIKKDEDLKKADNHKEAEVKVAAAETAENEIKINGTDKTPTEV
ncbi:uncharacterized protein LOC126778937 [Nymphalis io]|uniref:uncharacterized protein LOC126778937 n=1 Tax=Inachis io TaxID=171585 RepID=UPI0021682C93|nr:uncharacterized protein LOC126778937 [Nymphalis io]